MNKPKVSVSIIIYNQDNYIKDCIEGALNQIVDFDYEIIIGDDCSTDNTQQICAEYASKYSDLIKYYRRDENLGMIGNWTKTISECNGDYIALCEGDDYWTDPQKLQKQVDFLELNGNYSLCFHNAIVKNDVSNTIHLFNNIKKNKSISLEELMEWVIPSASIVFRASILPLPSWSVKIYSGDMTLALRAFMVGKIYSMTDCMSVYRQYYNNGSMTAMSSTYKPGYVQNQQIILYTFFDIDTKGIYSYAIKKHIRLLRNKQRYSEIKQLYGYLALLLVPVYTYWRIFGKKL